MEKLLSLSLTDLGKIKFSPELVNLNEFLAATIKEKEEKPCFSHKITFNTSARPVFVNIDKQLMKEVIFYIISNSIKYSPKDTPIKVNLLENQSGVTISITDQGKGIPGDEAENIFEPFYRGSNVEKVQGTGLGLTLAKQFVCLHGGDITFLSKVDEGTTFFITLPKKMVKEEF